MYNQCSWDSRLLDAWKKVTAIFLPTGREKMMIHHGRNPQSKHHLKPIQGMEGHLCKSPRQFGRYNLSNTFG